MTEGSDLERRIVALEERLHMEAGLRASGDRDLGNVRLTLQAQHRLIQALVITQSQHGDLLSRHSEMLTEHGETLARHGETLARLEGGVAHIIGLLDRLITPDQPTS